MVSTSRGVVGACWCAHWPNVDAEDLGGAGVVEERARGHRSAVCQANQHSAHKAIGLDDGSDGKRQRSSGPLWIERKPSSTPLLMSPSASAASGPISTSPHAGHLHPGADHGAGLREQRLALGSMYMCNMLCCAAAGEISHARAPTEPRKTAVSKRQAVFWNRPRPNSAMTLCIITA